MFWEWARVVPGRAVKKCLCFFLKRRGRVWDQILVCVRVIAGRGVMITGAFVAQGAIDDDKVWGKAGRGDLARRCEAEQEPAAAGEQFFSDEDGKRRPDSTADNSYRLPLQFEGIQSRVIAWPAFKRL